MPNEALNDLLNTGVPSVSFAKAKAGTIVSGRVLKLEKVQQRDMQTKEPLFWKDGNPKWQYVFTLATELRDPESEVDDGTRKLYAKGQMEKAIRDAIRGSAHRGDVEGGMLAVKFVKEQPAQTRGFNPQKVYAARFEPPAQTDEFQGEPEHAPEDYDSEDPF